MFLFAVLVPVYPFLLCFIILYCIVLYCIAALLCKKV